MRTIEEYIREFGNFSETDRHEKIVECLERYGLHGTRELSLEQAEEYYRILTGAGKGDQ